MLKRFLFPRRDDPPAAPALPDGRRVYAIGDIHGRLDLLDELLGRIVNDSLRRPAMRTTLIFLGDMIDRGPASAAVVERARGIAADGGDVRFLLGNHEEVFLLTMEGNEQAAALFCRIGGRETLISYGMDPYAFEGLDYPGVADLLFDLVPEAHRTFVAGFEDMVVIGDYAFVHAGVRPGVPIDAQRPEDLRWIRQPFLDHGGHFGKMVVHGHTISPQIEVRAHRIGIDTGGYASGRLSALGLEGSERWTIQTGD